jgi:hypothetical protein
MNTRSRTRVQAAKASSSSEPPPRNERMGIQLIGERPIARFSVLVDRQIKSTKWAFPTTINQLGITNDFNLLCNRVGLSPFVSQGVRTYRRLTLEILSTLTHDMNTMPPWNEIQWTERVKFCLINHDFELSFTEWCNCFRFVNNDTHIRWANGLLSPSPLEHFHSMALYNCSAPPFTKGRTPVYLCHSLDQ